MITVTRLAAAGAAALSVAALAVVLLVAPRPAPAAAAPRIVYRTVTVTAPPASGPALTFVSCTIGSFTPAMLGSNPAEATYTVTLSDPGTAPVSVGEISTAFFAGGSQDGSDEESVTGVIAPGQSQSWTLNVPSNLLGPSSVLASSCQIEQWSAP